MVKLFIFARQQIVLMQRFRIFFLVYLCFSSYKLLAKAPVFTEKDYLNHPPRIIRTCCAFGANLKVSIIPVYRYTMLTSIELLGPHKYLGGYGENNGILYTRRGGFIDIGHLRDLIDWTAYLYNLEKKSQEKGEVFINLGFEAGEKSLDIRIPSSENEENLITLAGRIAYDISIWHEITSWFGASDVPLVSEKFSSFSIEDAYSNLLGINIATEAIKSELPYDQAVTEAIKKTLIDLEAVSSKEESCQAMDAVREIWWTRKKHLPNNKIMLRREVGAYSPLTPWLVPGWESKNSLPLKLTVPETTPDGIPLSEFYSFTVHLSHKLPVKKIFADSSKHLVTQLDFQHIIAYIASGMLKKNILIKM